MNKDCDHEKVFENILLLSCPPKQRWICNKCGERGTDIIGEYKNSVTYNELVQKFSNINS